MNATATTTRASRRAARAWIALKGWTVWEQATWAQPRQCCNESWKPHHTSGAMLPSGNKRAPFLVVCLDCIPYPGAPIRGHEGWSTDAERDAPGDRCARCLLSLDGGGGGVYQRGGPFCWRCGSPPREVMDAWLIALRTDPSTLRPWAGDKKEGGDHG